MFGRVIPLPSQPGCWLLHISPTSMLMLHRHDCGERWPTTTSGPPDGRRVVKTAAVLLTVAVSLVLQLALARYTVGGRWLFDFVLVGVMGVTTYVMLTSATVPATTVDEFVAYARAHPGKLNYGSAGIGSIIHLAAEYLKRSVGGMNVVHVPYLAWRPLMLPCPYVLTVHDLLTFFPWRSNGHNSSASSSAETHTPAARCPTRPGRNNKSPWANRTCP